MARRLLRGKLPSSVSAFELPRVSLAMSFLFVGPEGRTASLHWEVRRAMPGAAAPARAVLSVSAQGPDGSKFAEWQTPDESDTLFRPGRERFQAFASAVRTRDSRLLVTPLAEARLTSALLRLGSVAAQVGRPLVFDPLRERLIGGDALQEPKLG